MNDDNTTTQQGFVVRWIVSTILGWFLGFLGGALLLTLLPYNKGNLIAEILSWIILLIVVWASASLVSLIQWSVTLYDKVSIRSWIIANGLAGSLSVLAVRLIPIGAAITEMTSDYSGFYQTYKVSNQWFILVLTFSIALGLSLSIPRWFILRNQHYEPQQLIPANILAIFISLSGMFLLILAADNDFRIMLLWCCINPVIIGGIIGMALYRILFKRLSQTL